MSSRPGQVPPDTACVSPLGKLQQGACHLSVQKLAGIPSSLFLVEGDLSLVLHFATRLRFFGHNRPVRT